MVAKHGSKRLKDLASLCHLIIPQRVTIRLNYGRTIYGHDEIEYDEYKSREVYGIIGFNQSEAVGKVVFRNQGNPHIYDVDAFKIFKKNAPEIIKMGIVKIDFAEDYSHGIRFEDIAEHKPLPDYYGRIIGYSKKVSLRKAPPLSFSPEDNKAELIIPQEEGSREEVNSLDFMFTFPKEEMPEQKFQLKSGLITLSARDFNQERALYAELLKPKYQK